MASTVKKGSSGSDVLELQKKLNAAGYSLDEDGQFGSKTQAAVKDYQSKNGLTVDGIVGTNTWASLNGGSTSTSSNKTFSTGDSYDWTGSATAQQLAQYETSSPTYSESSDTAALRQQLEAWEAKKPEDYKSNYQGQIDSLLNQILNRESFSYDFAADPMYQQIRDNYVNQGKMAMQDTMGQASALSGGYGNSYATTAGQQAYNTYLNSLNTEVIPELRQQAYDMYANEGETMQNNLSLLQNAEASDYGRYQDSYDNWMTELQYFASRYGDSRDFDYTKYSNDLAAWEADRDYFYNKLLSEQEQSNYERELALEVDQANYTAEQAEKAAAAASSKKTEQDDDDDGIEVSNMMVYDDPNNAGDISHLRNIWIRTGSDGMTSKMISGSELQQGVKSGKITMKKIGDKYYYYSKS